jgi:hypothetical protein
MSGVSPRALEAAMSAVDQIRDAMAEHLDVDDMTLWLDTIEGETNALELLDRIVERILADAALVEAARLRARRLETRAERLRAVVTRVLIDKLSVAHLERPLYTAAVSHRSKPVITDGDLLPAEYVRSAPDLTKIGRALRDGGAVPGAELSNPAPVLTITKV